MNPAPAHAAAPSAVIADVDTGMDDALALVFLARDPRIDLLAVTDRKSTRLNSSHWE